MKIFVSILLLFCHLADCENEQVTEDNEQQGYATNAAAEMYLLALILPGNYKNPTIHGLWPQYQRTKKNFRILDDYGPVNCNFYGTYQNLTKMAAAEAKGMFNDLLTKWPSYSSPNDKFWEHEWDKHGNCAPSLVKTPKPKAQLEYFNLALKLYDKYLIQLTTALNTLKKSASKSIKFSTVLDTFEKSVGKTVELTCEQKRVNGFQKLVVTGINVCIDIRATKDNLKTNLLVPCNRNLGTQFTGYCGGPETLVMFI